MHLSLSRFLVIDKQKPLDTSSARIVLFVILTYRDGQEFPRVNLSNY